LSALRLGTRGSELALAQAEQVAGLLRRAGHEIELVRIKTTGDVTLGPLEAVGGKRAWVKEIEDALLEGRIDLAVHSAKDLPG
jgi:hydroxymethylbilane synthase